MRVTFNLKSQGKFSAFYSFVPIDNDTVPFL